ncbi:MAG: outer membrane lipoprotein carrier protein LolA [Desulfarculaceae bacterium]|nr:outer membrane lipoprotein carrier protein LolA [Desulfarculaceae bacterium]MCF8074414.1 outer membrane lipoprotein carrier protein LolA [Desulfarculaceae bacterium]MCF8103610.1 outer membrane lipoprotein carrier protein LolA [Desulfarculaceae bacterium]MCF8116023.1 outer membrane lipoprotein carrier protein LolA [Desulfarculaceae bacterium]
MRADETAELAARIQKRYQGIDSLAASYTRSSRFVSLGAQGGRDVQGSGRLVWARPLKLRLEQETPRQELIIVGEGMAWWVRPARQRADLYPLNQFTGGLTSLLDALGGLARLDQDFKVSLATPQRTAGIPAGSLVVSLTPKVTRADLKELVLWFQPEDLLLRGFAIFNLVGDVTLYNLDQVQVNVSPPKSDFAYEPPVDYQVANHLPLNPGRSRK